MLKKENEQKSNLQSTNYSGNDVLSLFLGIILLGAGLFILSKKVIVSSGWYIWRFGGFDLSSGTITIPLIIGIIWYFFNNKSIIAKIVITLSIIFIVVSIIMSVRLYFNFWNVSSWIRITFKILFPKTQLKNHSSHFVKTVVFLVILSIIVQKRIHHLFFFFSIYNFYTNHFSSIISSH